MGAHRAIYHGNNEEDATHGNASDGTADRRVDVELFLHYSKAPDEIAPAVPSHG